MGIAIDLLTNYPKSKRNIVERSKLKDKEIQGIARNFGQEFFDGDRKYGYGGFNYDPKFWSPVIPTFQSYWNLTASSSLLDVGCAKGFMLFDLIKKIDGITVKGIDISEYAIENSLKDIKPFLSVGNAKNLPFDDNTFDVVTSINTVHNLEKNECGLALQEIQRVCKNNSFITVDAYNNDEEKEKMYAWNLTAKTIMSVDEWIKFFDEVGYLGDYYWFIP